MSAGVGRVAAGRRRGWVSCVRCGERHHWNTKCRVEPLHLAQGSMDLCLLPGVEAECVLLASRCGVLVLVITVCVCVYVCVCVCVCCVGFEIQ